MLSIATGAQKEATWTGGGGDNSYDNPDNWDIDGAGNPGSEVPINNGTDTYKVIIPASVTVNFDVADPGSGTNTVDEFALGAGSVFTVQASLDLDVIGAADVGGLINVNNEGIFNAPSAASNFTGNSARILVQGSGVTTATLGAGTYDSRGVNSGTILLADGTSSTLDLSKVGLINDSSNQTFAQVRTIQASNGGSINLSSMHTLLGGAGDDITRITESAGGTVNLSGLTTVTGNVNFVSDKSNFSLPSLSTAGAITFTLNPATILDLPELLQQTGGAYDLPPVATVNLNKLTTLNSATVTMSNAGAVFNAPVLANIDNSFFNLSGGATLALPNVTAYTGTGFDNGAFFSADGLNTVLDLQSITTLDSSSNRTFAQVRTISASANGLVDLSNLETIHGGTGDDIVEVKMSGGGVVRLDNLTTTTGNVRFNTDTDLLLDKLQNADSLFFNVQPGAQVDLNALVSQSGGAYELPAGNIFNMPQLTTMTGTTVTISDPGATFNAPLLGNIDNSFFNLSGGTTLALPNVTAYTGTAFDGGAFLSADGIGTDINLQSMTTLDSSSNRTFAQVRTITASGNGQVDLRNLQTLHGGTGDDIVEVKMSGGGVVRLDNLTTTTGNVRFDTDINLQLDKLQNADSLYFTMQPNSQLDLGVLVSQSGGDYDLPAGATFNLPLLTTMTGTALSISDSGATFDAPLLGDIDNSFVNLSGGTALALPNVTTYTGTAFANGIFFSAQGASTSLDLSALQSIDSAVNHTFAQTRTIHASEGGFIDLSAVDTLQGGTGDDWLRILVESSGQIDLSALQSVSVGNVIFDIEAEGSLKLGDFTVTGNTTFNINDATSGVDVAGSLLLDALAEFNVATAGGISVGGNFSFATQAETAFSSAAGILAMDGAGTFVNPQFLEVGGEDLGLPANLTDPTVIPGDNGNFAIGQLIVGQEGQSTIVTLLDAIDNGNRSSLEALYLPGFGSDGLQILGGSTLFIDAINVYAFLDGEWLLLNDQFVGGITQISMSSLTDNPAADGFITIIPEPATLSLLGLGGLAFLRRRRV
ncbi:MAG: PEP-CTERM sorting domain-containing protein [Sedimentisphaerales bacterium]|nr:PEP-CTERM sorting domain-containing protein [Sedimentisphaerales bacterium]